MRAYVLSTGDELVRGRGRDTNTSEIARALAAEGIDVVGASLVGDDVQALADGIVRACGRADLVVMSGGLGPTTDDCTRLAAAKAAGVELVRDGALEEWLLERWRAIGKPMPPSNLLQADLPRGAEAIPNDFGTAPGFLLTLDDTTFIALPGPPREMRGVLEAQALPRIRTRLGDRDRIVVTRTLETFGEREARIGEMLEDLMARGGDPVVGTTAADGAIRVVVHSAGPAAATRERVEEVLAEIRSRLGNRVFGEDAETLPQALGRLLIRSGTTVATAESCTGGLVAAALTSVAGISRVFPGGVVTYSNEEKTRLLGVPEELIAAHGAVSGQVAVAMAQGVRAHFGTDVGVSTTGVAGPGGGTESKPVGLVYLGVDVRGQASHRRLRLTGDRRRIRVVSTQSALDLVRRSISR